MSDERKRRADANQKQKVLSRWENEGGRVETVKKRPRDANQLAKAIVDLATGEASDEEAKTVVRARKAGKAGGRARARSLTPEERSEIARVAAEARWKKG